MKNTIILTTLLLLFISIAGGINSSFDKPNIEISKQESAVNINKEILGLASFGQKRLITDILWVTTLLESDLEHYKKNNLNSWLYHRFNTIIHLDPDFYKAYIYGGQYLDIVKDDLQGAKDIYTKGLEKFPDDYDLLFNAGFLFTFELKEFETALKIYSKLIKIPKAPPYVISVYHKLKYESNSFSLVDTLNSLKDLFKTLDEKKDHLLYGRIRHDIYRVKAQIDLECLNQNKENCDKVDALGNPYIFTNGAFHAKIPWTPYGIKKKN